MNQGPRFPKPKSAAETQERLDELNGVLEETLTWTVGDIDANEKRERLRTLSGTCMVGISAFGGKDSFNRTDAVKAWLAISLGNQGAILLKKGPLTENDLRIVQHPNILKALTTQTAQRGRTEMESEILLKKGVVQADLSTLGTNPAVLGGRVTMSSVESPKAVGKAGAASKGIDIREGGQDAKGGTRKFESGLTGLSSQGGTHTDADQQLTAGARRETAVDIGAPAGEEKGADEKGEQSANGYEMTSRSKGKQGVVDADVLVDEDDQGDGDEERNFPDLDGDTGEGGDNLGMSVGPEHPTKHPAGNLKRKATVHSPLVDDNMDGGASKRPRLEDDASPNQEGGKEAMGTHSRKGEQGEHGEGKAPSNEAQTAQEGSNMEQGVGELADKSPRVQRPLGVAQGTYDNPCLLCQKAKRPCEYLSTGRSCRWCKGRKVKCSVTNAAPKTAYEVLTPGPLGGKVGGDGVGGNVSELAGEPVLKKQARGLVTDAEPTTSPSGEMVNDNNAIDMYDDRLVANEEPGPSTAPGTLIRESEKQPKEREVSTRNSALVSHIPERTDPSLHPRPCVRPSSPTVHPSPWDASTQRQSPPVIQPASRRLCTQGVTSALVQDMASSTIQLEVVQMNERQLRIEGQVEELQEQVQAASREAGRISSIDQSIEELRVRQDELDNTVEGVENLNKETTTGLERLSQSSTKTMALMNAELETQGLKIKGHDNTSSTQFVRIEELTKRVEGVEKRTKEPSQLSLVLRTQLDQRTATDKARYEALSGQIVQANQDVIELQGKERATADVLRRLESTMATLCGDNVQGMGHHIGQLQSKLEASVSTTASCKTSLDQITAHLEEAKMKDQKAWDKLREIRNGDVDKVQLMLSTLQESLESKQREENDAFRERLDEFQTLLASMQKEAQAFRSGVEASLHEIAEGIKMLRTPPNALDPHPPTVGVHKLDPAPEVLPSTSPCSSVIARPPPAIDCVSSGSTTVASKSAAVPEPPDRVPASGNPNAAPVVGTSAPGPITMPPSVPQASVVSGGPSAVSPRVPLTRAAAGIAINTSTSGPHPAGEDPRLSSESPLTPLAPSTSSASATSPTGARNAGHGGGGGGGGVKSLIRQGPILNGRKGLGGGQPPRPEGDDCRITRSRARTQGEAGRP